MPTSDPQLTQAQLKLEEKYGTPIKAIVERAFDDHKYQQNMSMKVAIRLGVSLPTLKAWCKQLDIKPRKYRYAPGSEPLAELSVS